MGACLNEVKVALLTGRPNTAANAVRTDASNANDADDAMIL